MLWLFSALIFLADLSLSYNYCQHFSYCQITLTLTYQIPGLIISLLTCLALLKHLPCKHLCICLCLLFFPSSCIRVSFIFMHPVSQDRNMEIIFNFFLSHLQVVTRFSHKYYRVPAIPLHCAAYSSQTQASPPHTIGPTSLAKCLLPCHLFLCYIVLLPMEFLLKNNPGHVSPLFKDLFYICVV